MGGERSRHPHGEPSVRSSTRVRPDCAESGSRSPQGAEIDSGVAGLPAAEEALDRRMPHPALELTAAIQPVAATPGGPRPARPACPPTPNSPHDDMHHVHEPPAL